MMRRLLCILISATLLAPSLAVPSHAQQKAAPAAKTKAGAKSKAAPGWKTTTANATLPNDVALNMLIRGTLLTLNDANRSGNYSVLRDLAGPGFQQANDVKKLADGFADLRSRKVDMAPIVYFTPTLVRKPQLTKSGRLRLSGFVPTRPEQVNFDMLFEKHGKRWLLYGISVIVAAPKTANAAPKGKAGKTTPKKKK
jgi:hypothetical protein